MKTKFKQAFESYYNRLYDLYHDEFSTEPTICYDTDEFFDPEIDRSMILSEPSEDGESIWGLLKVGDYDFSEIEQTIGFTLNEELKAFYSSYLFLHLAGDYILNQENEIVTLYFDALKSKGSIEKMAIIASKNGNYYFEGSQTFAIGSANYSGDDAYIIFYDNETGKVFIYESDTENKIELPDSLLEIINKLEAIF